VHYSAGVEKNFTEDLSLGVEGFYKSLYDRVVSPDRAVDSRPFVNDGIGRIYGLEVSGRKNAKGRWFGFLSYTLMRSERKDRDQPWRLFDFDQTHVFTALASYELGRGFDVGVRFRYATGYPRTPVVGAYYASRRNLYEPVLGAKNSIRIPDFAQLDVRVSKTLELAGTKGEVYADIQNVTNRHNAEEFAYNQTYGERRNIRGLPFLPVVGLRWEF
jgi:hypothetical protein